MNSYLLIYNKDFKGLTVTQSDSKAQAEQLATDHSGGDFGLAVSDPSDLKHLSMHEMVDMYREMTGTTVNRFRDLAAGQKRIFVSIKGLVDKTIQPKSDTGEVIDKAVKGKKTKQKVAAKTTKGEPKKSGVDRKRHERINLNGKLDIIAKENPRVEGSKAWVSWKIMRQGMIVSTFIKLGGRQADLRHDIKHGRVRIVEA